MHLSTRYSLAKKGYKTTSVPSVLSKKITSLHTYIYMYKYIVIRSHFLWNPLSQIRPTYLSLSPFQTPPGGSDSLKRFAPRFHGSGFCMAEPVGTHAINACQVPPTPRPQLRMDGMGIGNGNGDGWMVPIFVGEWSFNTKKWGSLKKCKKYIYIYYC